VADNCPGRDFLSVFRAWKREVSLCRSENVIPYNSMALPGQGRINVLFVMIQMAMGGSERLVHNVVQRLDRSRYNPHIAWFFGEEISNEFRDLGVPLFHVPKIKRFDFSTMRRMSDIVRDHQIHVVNAHHFMSMVYSFYGCKIRNRAKLIYTEHSQWEVDKISWKWKQIGARLLSRVEGVVGVTEAVTDKLRSHFRLNGTKIVTIQNGVDLEHFKRKDRREVMRRELGLQNHDKVIGTIANFKRIKNHRFLLEAFKKLTEDFDQAKLVLVGQGFEDDQENTEDELRQFVKDNRLTEKVLFLGYRSDVAAVLSAMDVFCLASWREGLPLSLIEAMSMGLPVVGTDVEGIRELIRDGTNGFLVPVDDVEALKQKLLFLLHDEVLRKTLGSESRSLIEPHYSLDHCVKLYEQLFASTLENTSDRR
jgi:glycosyltransferase involved in cell wall biosynthesis